MIVNDIVACCCIMMLALDAADSDIADIRLLDERKEMLPLMLLNSY